jgi:eukaryotic-like serine/threonine-protein kinase
LVGQTLSHYEIIAKLGEGGMGVVYKARDVRLDRFVCIKVLRPEQLKDESRKQRFIQEAKSASSLNHPNIITIHEIDQADGTDFMVMEFVAGKTFQQLIPSGGLPVADVLKYAIPIASALAAANAAGIIHRDIKPGNIMVGANGIVKVLDFGLAKLTAPEENSDGATQTIKANTEEGTVVGTAAYMSPEQAQGKAVDARSDIFSFGAVLYEMLTGRRAFQGDNRMSTLASILQQEPKPLAELDSRIPRELDRIVVRCLRKDPDRRFQHMADLKVTLEELKEESDSGKLTPAPSAAQSTSRTWIALGLSAALVLLSVIAAWLWWHAKPGKTAERRLTRLTSNGVSFDTSISADGKLLAYLSSAGGPNPDIWVQQIGGGKAIQITHEKDGAASPVFSPDGTQISYVARGGIYEVPALGGDPRLIINDGIGPFYSTNGSLIVFARVSQNTFQLFAVPRLGGTPVAIHPEVSLGAPPVMSPDGSRVLALATHAGRQVEDQKFWWIIPLIGGNLQRVVPPPLLAGETRPPAPSAWTALDRDPSQQWVIFERSIGDTHNLFRVAMSSDGKVTQEPEQLTFATGLATSHSVSGSGRMVFDSSTGSTNLWSIPIDTNHARVTGERQKLTQVDGVRDDAPSVSRDGKKVAFFSDNRLVLKDLVTGQETQLVRDFLVFRGNSPRISPDGSFVAYYLPSGGQGTYDLFVIGAAGGAPRRVCQACGGPGGFSSDGSRILMENFGVSLDRITSVDLATGKVTDVLGDPQHALWNPFYSWDDQWMSFLMQTGADQDHYRIYVTPVANLIPGGPDRWIQLTTGEYHDDKQQFSPDGNTMYFTSNRDGFTCLWALRLDPKTKHPQGAPFAIQHFHGSQRIYSGISESNHMEVNVAKDKIITNLDEFHSDIWMMELEPGK